VFLVVSLVSLIVTRPLVKRFKKRNKTTGTNADRHIGQVGFMLTDSLEN
jgi:membrane protein implicated in regulation of membrane protease activity